MKAIETIYKGHRFRSRLEARWAVVFDTLGIEWQYEPQGYECGARLTKSLWWEEYPRINYLPDFWLPGEGVFVEVKGEFTSEEKLIRFLDCAAYLSLGETQFGCTEGAVGARPVVVLGPRLLWGWKLMMRKGSMSAVGWFPAMSRADRVVTEGDTWDVADDGTAVGGDAYQGRPWGSVARTLVGGTPYTTWSQALDIGRQARFEHGEVGTPGVAAWWSRVRD